MVFSVKTGVEDALRIMINLPIALSKLFHLHRHKLSIATTIGLGEHILTNELEIGDFCTCAARRFCLIGCYANVKKRIL